jgi:hypothetical protein
MALIETEEAARRLARAIASALFKSRVAPDLFAKGLYDRAVIDILVRPKGHVASKMW